MLRIPLSSVCRQRARIGRGIKALNPGGAGAKPPKPAPIPKLPSETERPLIMRDLPLFASIDIWEQSRPLALAVLGSSHPHNRFELIATLLQSLAPFRY